MKYLGQHIENFIAKFRQDVYLESVPNPGSDTDKFLVIDSDGKIGQRTGAEVASDIGVSGTFVDLTSEVTGILPVANGGTGASSLTDNSVLIGNGTSAITPSPNFTFDGDDLLLESANLQKPTFTIKNTNNSANPAILSFVKDKGAVGADNDIAGRIDFTSDNDAQEQHPFGNITTSVSAARDGNEEGKIAINVCAFASASGTVDGNVITGEGNGDSIVDVTLGAGATGVTTIAGTLTIGSTAFVNNSGVIQVATQGTIDHDSLANFVAAEHYRWDTDISSTATINAANIPTLNQSTTGNAATATALATARNINGVSFDGTGDITVTAAGSTLSDTVTVAKGGTGATSLTDNAVLLGNGTSAVEASAHLTYSNFAPGGGVDIDQLTVGDASSTGAKVLTPGTVPMTVGPDASSGSNVAGANLTLQGGQSTGNTAGGSIRFLSSVTGSSGSIPNSTAEIASFDNVGNLQLDGGITTGSTSFVNSSGIIQTAAQTNITSLGTLTGLTIGGDLTVNGDTVTFESANTEDPQVTIKNTTDGTNDAAQLFFVKDRGVAPAVSTNLGEVRFVGEDSNQNSQEYGGFLCEIDVATDGQESGQFGIFVASHDGELQYGLQLTGGSAEDEIDVSIANGTSSVTTVAGDLTVTSNLTAGNVRLPGDGTISFDDSLDGTDQFITGTDSNLTIDGDDKIKLRADTQIEVKSTSNTDTVIITNNSGNIYTAGDIELGHASDTTISRSAAGTVTIEGNQVVTAGVGTGNLVHVVLKDMGSYLFYMYNDDYWYSAGSGTLAILGLSTDPSAISSSNSEYQSRVAAYIAPQACVVKKLCFSFYWSSSVVNSADIDFGFSKFTPISDGTAASITMNKIDATDHNASYTEVKPYYKTFTFSGANATLAAGDSFAFHMRTTGGQSAQRVIVYGTAILEVELS